MAAGRQERAAPSSTASPRKGEQLRAGGQEAVHDVFKTSFHSLSAAQLQQLGDLLDAALGPDPTA